ncbi:tripartite tricarboxylate transporter TctB family protein [Kribbella antibiotica]|uniref:tripartite tricarboxylate transporter TctB family protein n=1 Tax=Kribbella antibiotica TaxID=190195 RepID=UPI0014049661|nr:tripartite tricarboxylate transporter TctB family protein [Kribbella antibiotica]
MTERPLAQLGAAGVAGAIGVFGLVGSLALGLGRLTAPGPGLWPFTVSVVITVLAVVLALTGRHGTDTEGFTRASVQTAVAVLSLVVFAALLPLIGFEIPSLLLVFVWMRFLARSAGCHRWPSALARWLRSTCCS